MMRTNIHLLKKCKASGLSLLWIAILVMILDRLSKMWVMQHLTPFEPLPILPVFNFTLAYNKGAAFSFLNTASGWQNGLLSSVAIVVCLIILVWLARLPASHKWMSTALCFIMGGALSNVWDRMCFGHVIDFLDFHLGNWHFAIFNLADSAIFFGAVILLWSWYRQKT